MEEDETLDSIVLKSTEKDRNPFVTIGMPSWMIKSMSDSQIKSFLGDYKKALSKQFHPDKMRDNPNRYIGEAFFKSLTNAIDELLKDGFFFQRSVYDIRTNSIVEIQKDKIKSQQGVIESQKSKINKLSDQVQHSKLQLDQVYRDIANVQRFNDQYIMSGNGFSLHKRKNFNLTYQLYSLDPSQIQKLTHLYMDDSKDSKNLESEATDVNYKLIDQWKKDSMNQESKRQKSKKQDKGTFTVSVRNKNFTVEYEEKGKKGELITFRNEIVGGLSYYALREFCRLQDYTLGQAINVLRFDIPRQSPSQKDEAFENSNIEPFLTHSVLPSHPLLVRRYLQRDQTKSYDLLFALDIN